MFHAVPPPLPQRFIAILGYGAPADPLKDGHLEVYLETVVRIMRRPRQHDEIFLMGGCTNRTDLTEASAMRQWFDEYEPVYLPHLLLEDKPISARESIATLAERWDGYTTEVEFVIFCEYSRRWMIRLLCRRLLPGRDVTVVGIKFDDASLTRSHRLYQAGPRLLLEWAALHSAEANRVREQLRIWFIHEARRKAAS